MSNYNVSKIYLSDKRSLQQIDLLLQREGLHRDKNLDYTCGIYDGHMNIIATGSCFGNTLRCLAVSSSHQGEGLLNEVITHLIEFEHARGNRHLFLYTKCNTAKFFSDLGFYEIIRIEDQVVFMENRRHGFSDYLQSLSDKTCPASKENKIAAIVINANPFTLGHLYLVEKATSENDILHLFIVSEDASLIPFSIRKKLVIEGTSHLRNIVYHDSGPYIISSATFPSYFQKDEVAVISSHAELDLEIFKKISSVLGIRRRYVGEEPSSQVTGIYNQIMHEKLPQAGIDCIVIPRKEVDGNIISASVVRKALQDDAINVLKNLVPETTLRFFQSKEALPIIRKIKISGNVIHY
ncbi:[citrate (pro-3S)-lyase] ligase [Sporomusaceae bacterium BoRhaA]|uniref:[citrate (pro-3S)-lyase] ligase n=1 Tax=Pelorhabdus rhamnosifermentans TaxID=2772457 RepID=UPI001C05F7EB|nr:[citrate (pro-3S)-lyase] ligase [Pelorhabdus rhamnosifermentans]MBU2703980.1 [citrate (pro-3S)-lyase] ligase [Pelorhabdus rhamnosifermentans]